MWDHYIDVDRGECHWESFFEEVGRDRNSSSPTIVKVLKFWKFLLSILGFSYWSYESSIIIDWRYLDREDLKTHECSGRILNWPTLRSSFSNKAWNYNFKLSIKMFSMVIGPVICKRLMRARSSSLRRCKFQARNFLMTRKKYHCFYTLSR